jgi:hypothetical protein
MPMAQHKGQFNRLSFYTYIEELKQEILVEGGDRALIIVPVLVQIQEVIDRWTSLRRTKGAYGSRFVGNREAAGYRLSAK